jgi:hypothetical protein
MKHPVLPVHAAARDAFANSRTIAGTSNLSGLEALSGQNRFRVMTGDIDILLLFLDPFAQG